MFLHQIRCLLLWSDIDYDYLTIQIQITHVGQVSGDVSRNKKFKAEATVVPQMQQPGKIMLIKKTPKIPPNSDTAALKQTNKKIKQNKSKVLSKVSIPIVFFPFPPFSLLSSLVYLLCSFYSFACFLKFLCLLNTCFVDTMFQFFICFVAVFFR